MFENRTGSHVPQVTFHTRRGHEWADVTTDDIFKGKTVVVFSLPGAFTPTCSSSHVPRYNQLVPTFKKHGVDEVVCMSVNDTFVMNEWKKAQHADNVTFIPDGNGEFTDGMGMLVDKDDLASASAPGATPCWFATASSSRCSSSRKSKATPTVFPMPTPCSPIWHRKPRSRST